MTPSKPWWPWLLTALAFPPAGLLRHAVAGPADSVPSAALGGVAAGAVTVALLQSTIVRDFVPERVPS